ncbi:hypothetical protein [Desulfosarcina cetonica]|nr:hypothetical protein [Desulfosarcina cetonica]
MKLIFYLFHILGYTAREPMDDGFSMDEKHRPIPVAEPPAISLVV